MPSIEPLTPNNMTEQPFVPRPDQVDFTNARWCPVINCVVIYDSKLLLVERNKDMRLYPEYWNGISGFLDDQKSLAEKVQEELHEEIGVSLGQIKSIQLKGIFDQEAPELGKTWVVHAVRVEITTNQLTFDWEAQNHAWVSQDEALAYRLLPGFDEVLEAAFS